MGTTRTAIQTGKARLEYVLAIEGIPDLYTTHSSTAAVVTAWAATNYASCRRGLQYPGTFRQSVEPFRPRIEGDVVTFQVANDDLAADVFAFVKSSGNSTRLRTSADCDDATLVVDDTTGFSATGAVYTGTEYCSYSGKTGISFTGCTRGELSPFNRNGASTFGRPHRIATVADVPVSYPLVTDYPRIWAGRMVGLWACRLEGSTVDVIGESELIFAGKISDIRENSAHLLSITCVDMRQVMADTMILADQYQAEITAGVALSDGTDSDEDRADYIEITEEFHSTGFVPVNDVNTERMTVGSGGWIAAGSATAEDLVTAVNEFLNSVAANYIGAVAVELKDGAVSITTNYETGVAYGQFKITALMTPAIALLLGYDIENPTDHGGAPYHDPQWTVMSFATPPHKQSLRAPLMTAYGVVVPMPGQSITLNQAQGSWINQYQTLPKIIQSIWGTAGGNWGVVEFDGRYTLVEYVSDTELIPRIDPKVYQALGGEFQDTTMRRDPVSHRHQFADNGMVSRVGQEPPKIKQVIFLEGDFSDLFTQILASTGTTGHNTVTYDKLAYNLGAAIPWDLLGTTIVSQLQDMEDMSNGALLSMVIDKPTRLEELIISELQLRNCHAIFKDGTLQFTLPRIPTTVSTDHTLDKTSLGIAPSRTKDYFPQVDLTRDDIINHIKIEFNRDISGGYHGTVPMINEQSKTDHGETSPITIQARNSYAFGREYSTTAIHALAAYIGGTALTTFARPLPRCTRPLSVANYFIAPGDSALVSDEFIRDPQTGTRGLVNVPALITAVRQNWGPQNARGQVEFIIVGAGDRFLRYSPVAQVDDSENGGSFSSGWDSGSNTFRMYENEYSLSTEVADASHFAPNDVVLISELSPAIPASPVQWIRTVASVSSNDIVLTVGLSSPAFDSAIKYRITSAIRSSAQSSQTVAAYIGDQGDGQILNTVKNNFWGRNPLDTLAVTKATSRRHEYPVDDGTWANQGYPVHPGLMRNAVDTANNGIDYKARHRMAHQWYVDDRITTAADTYIVVAMFITFVGNAKPGTLKRQMVVGPRLHTDVAGSTTTCRVTISTTQPKEDRSGGRTFTLAKVDKPAISQEFTHTGDTTVTNVTSIAFDFPHRDQVPYRWVTVELKTSGGGPAPTAAFYGFHEFGPSVLT